MRSGPCALGVRIDLIQAFIRVAPSEVGQALGEVVVWLAGSRRACKGEESRSLCCDLVVMRHPVRPALSQ